MSFPKYLEYKDSGVEWLGEVPAHWGITIGKRLFSNRKERPHEEDEQLSATQKYGVVPQSKFMESEQQKVTLALSGTSSFRHVGAGDFVISLRSFQGGIEISNYSGCVSPAYTVMTPSREADRAYFKHLLKSYGFISIINSVSDGIRDGKTISYEQFSRVAFPVPPKEEQRLVASFLDHETAQIDVLVNEQQRLIELLKEKRQAVISHAVTKGLDPDVPMKDSGVEWLGEVPAHWEVSRLKHVTDRIIDCPHETPVYDPDGDFLVIRTADLEYGVLDPQLMYRLDEGEYNSRTRRSTLGCGDIVYGREGERWGHAALVPEDDKYCLGQRMMQFIPSDVMCPEFLMWQLNSDNVYHQGDVDVVGATSPHVNVSTIRNYYISVPPEKEQLAISKFLNEESSAFDELVHSANSIVALLQERRSALISAAVTGKIDVRGWQPPADSPDLTEATQTEMV